MPKTKQQKKDLLKAYEEKLQKAKTIVFVDYTGLKVKDNEELRKQAKKENSEYIAGKKTLLKMALEKKGLKEMDPKTLPGSLALVLGYEDEIAPAKVVQTFAKKNNTINILGGIMNDKALQAQEVIQLAKLPSKQELLGKLVATINAPVSGFVNVLAGNLRGLVQVLNGIKEKKEQSA